MKPLLIRDAFSIVLFVFYVPGAVSARPRCAIDKEASDVSITSSSGTTRIQAQLGK